MNFYAVPTALRALGGLADNVSVRHFFFLGRREELRCFKKNGKKLAGDEKEKEASVGGGTTTMRKKKVRRIRRSLWRERGSQQWGGGR